MRTDSFKSAAVCFKTILATVVASSGVASAQPTFEVLHEFAGASGDGALPGAALIQASDGSFYGTTEFGGSLNLGTVFKMTPDGTVTLLHEFAGGSDGAKPRAALIQTSDGNFYGASDGGAFGQGTVFRMSSDGTGYTVLHAFEGGIADGATPSALIHASDGNFYGTTSNGGGALSLGTVFQLSSDGTGYTILHAFGGAGGDGALPRAGLIEAEGNFYGTTYWGGAFDLGTVFQIAPDGTVVILHSFAGDTDGWRPIAALIHATDGKLYGTTSRGGDSNFGTIFRITLDGIGYGVAYTFMGGEDGANPNAGLIQATDGNFYGTTQNRGTFSAGTVFKMDPTDTVTVLHAFTGQGGTDYSALIEATDAKLYGTASRGGASGNGVVFRITP